MNRPVQKKPSSLDIAYAAIKRRVLDNEFAPNSQHLEQDLAEMLKLSRTPVREALQRLAGEGLVEIVPRRGIRVVPLSANDMADIYLILTGLEAAAAQLLAERGLTAGQLTELDAPLDDMDRALDQDNLLDWAHADECFHKTLVKLTGNGRLISIVDRLWDQSHRARMTTLKLRPKPVQSNLDHRNLVDAIQNRQPQKAWQIHSNHRNTSGAMLVTLLEDLGLKQL